MNINIIEGEETTHFSIYDKWGNAVSNTYTLNTAYGSGIIPTGTGILMNNEMDDFSSKPGHPNTYGLIGSEANKIEPKKTPLSSMSPAIVFRDERPYLITGSPGGSTIITSVLQEILNILDFQMSLEESSKKNRIHFCRTQFFTQTFVADIICCAQNVCALPKIHKNKLYFNAISFILLLLNYTFICDIFYLYFNFYSKKASKIYS